MIPQALAPSRTAALSRLAQVQPSAYARTRNHLAGAVTGLSPYLTHGLLTLPEVLADLLRRGQLEVGHKLVFELGWRAFFRHVWAHQEDGILQSLHAGPLPEKLYAQVLPEDIRQARTGTLHNHARMWLASYVVHLRHVHWRTGADWMVGHLLDGDLASNHLSWQWVAGTGSHKPYLFNAENVARYAPAHWHSGGTVLDCSYETLDALARTPRTTAPGAAQPQERTGGVGSPATPEPPLYATPPLDLPLGQPDASFQEQLQGREVWLVHPWALRAPPPDLPSDALLLGVYLREHHTLWPWSEARWRWVDAAMAGVTAHRWFIDTPSLARALSGAARVRSVADPHVERWLAPLAELDPAPALFPSVPRPCTSFSQWWTRATRGLHDAQELL